MLWNLNQLAKRCLPHPARRWMCQHCGISATFLSLKNRNCHNVVTGRFLLPLLICWFSANTGCGFSTPPLWHSLTWLLNFPSSQFHFIVWLLCTAEGKENRHQSLWLSVGYCQSVQEYSHTWRDSWYHDISSERTSLTSFSFVPWVCIYIHILTCVFILHFKVQVYKEESQTAQINTGPLQKIFYTWGRRALLRIWECCLCVDLRYLPRTILVFLFLQCIDLCGWWECRRG